MVITDFACQIMADFVKSGLCQFGEIDHERVHYYHYYLLFYKNETVSGM